MAKLRYPFDGTLPNASDDPWTKLDTIVEYLQDGEPIPRDLAAWLGEAIRLSGRDPDELPRRLGVKRGRGPKADPNAWFTVGRRICDLEDNGMKPEKAVATVAAELDDGQDEKYSRSQLQNLRDAYRAAWHVAHHPE
ncbi:hypothetical protein [Pseudogemmobacter sonorensis]|uniref:hypothetical protein n=1 Tax=Pseudogemmobacter sonorensis TaxID=2989681 RepID=UPI00367EF4E4